MTAYRIWFAVMYCVGVFVTCNVGGILLRMAVSRVSDRTKRRAVAESASADGQGQRRHPFDGLPFDDMNRYSDIENAAEANGAERFQEIQRQIERPEGSAETPATDSRADA